MHLRGIGHLMGKQFRIEIQLRSPTITDTVSAEDPTGSTTKDVGGHLQERMVCAGLRPKIHFDGNIAEESRRREVTGGLRG